MAPISIAQNIATPCQRINGEVEVYENFTRIATFAEVRDLVENSQPLRRPNRCVPIHSGEGEAKSWCELEEDELTGQQIREIADYLRSTGEAST